MSLKKMFCACIAVFVFDVCAGDTLSLDAYVKMALAHNVQMRMAEASVKSSIASEKSALSALLPHVNANAQVTRSNSTASATSNYYGAGVTANQLVFDFGKSWYTKGASSKLVDAARINEKGTMQNVVVNAVTAYYQYLLSTKLREVALDALRQMQQHLEQAKILFETGKQARYTVSAAESDVAKASVSVITAESNVRLAKVQMDVAAGISLNDSVILADSLDKKELEIPLADAKSFAKENRPDLLAFQRQCESAKLQLQSAKMTLFPSVNASAGYGIDKFDNGSGWENNWNVGVNLSLSLYAGGALRASIDQASAAYDEIAAQYEQAQLTDMSAIEQYFYEKVEAQQSIDANRKLIASAQDALSLAQERFTAGIAASLEVTDAEVTLANAKSSYAQALYNYRVAHANLLASMGNGLEK